jgi:hypothetical protein
LALIAQSDLIRIIFTPLLHARNLQHNSSFGTGEVLRCLFVPTLNDGHRGCDAVLRFNGLGSALSSFALILSLRAPAIVSGVIVLSAMSQSLLLLVLARNTCHTRESTTCTVHAAIEPVCDAQHQSRWLRSKAHMMMMI